MTFLNYTIEESKVHINGFVSTAGVRYITLDKSYASRETLQQILPDQNIDFKMNMWGTRGENEQPIRAFFIKTALDPTEAQDATNDDVIGYVNLGVNNLTINGKTLLEGGAFFTSNHKVSYDAEIVEAVNDVYVEYAGKLHADKVITAPGCIYTMAEDSPLYVLFKQSKLNEVTNLNDENSQCIVRALETNPKRFTLDYEHNQVLESGAKKAVFFVIYDQDACKVSGEVEVSTDTGL